MMINYTDCENAIKQVLSDVGILEVINKDSSIYVGGSLPSFIISQNLSNKKDEIVCNDIDLYTTNYVKTLHNITKYLGNSITNIKRTGVNVSFLVTNATKAVPIQIITSEFKSFNDDILNNYDCTLVAVGYYPFAQPSNQFITHQKFLNGLINKKFICYYEKSNPPRIIKLTKRALEWFNSTLEIVKETDIADFRPYYKKTLNIESLQDIVSPPNYVQLYYNKYTCARCSSVQDYLLCKPCVSHMKAQLYQKCKLKQKKITILGGVNGLGKIIGEVSREFNNDVVVTSRNVPNAAKNTYAFTLGKETSNNLMEHLLTSDVIVLNAYSTLENDESIWLTTLDTFNEKLAVDKFLMNTIGYAKFLQEFVQKRKEQIKTHNLTNNILMVFMDANESKFEGKLSDGKHLELNMAKTATKQIFYTNANLLASLGVLTVCYDVTWLSYHGISVDKIESKSKYLIPPEIASLSLLYKLGQIDFDEYIDKKKVIFDCSTYDVFKEL